MNKAKFKKLLRDATGCTIQHNGWTCGSCFFGISDKLTNKDWQALLLYRGDYKREELNNLPEDIEYSINKIFYLCGGKL